MAVPKAFEQEDHFFKKKRLETKVAIKQTARYSFCVKLVGNSVREE
jgi:hypothetical protein